MLYDELLEDIRKKMYAYQEEGEVASYIPALKNVNPNRFAMSIQLFDGKSYHIGDSDFNFSIQSISKLFTFTLALKEYSTKLYERVGHEPSGDPFNSLIQLEYEKGIPRNPFINAGAIVTTDSLVSIHKKDTFNYILDFIKKSCDDNSIEFDEDIFVSELQTGYTNMALVNLMKSYGNIINRIEEVMYVYFQQCSIKMSTKQLAKSVLFLANHGVNPLTNEQYISQSQAKRINSVMLTCGHYDASGNFAYKVGIPGKSGVGGGIVAVVPKKMSICVYSPKLNDEGNSLIGTKALELFTSKTGISIF